MKDLELDLDEEILLVQTPGVLVQPPNAFVQTPGAFLRSTFLLQSPASLKRFNIIGDLSKKRKQDEAEYDREIKRLKKELGELAPSSLASADKFRHVVGPDHTISFNRPFVYDTIPIELLDEVFGKFKNRCDVPPSDKAFSFLEALAPVACEWYKTELERMTEVQVTFEQHTGLQLHTETVSGTKFLTDGNLSVIVMPVAVRECNNEDGHAVNQATLCYAKFLLSALNHPHSYHKYNTRFPCILVVDRGMPLFIDCSHSFVYGILRSSAWILWCRLEWACDQS